MTEAPNINRLLERLPNRTVFNHRPRRIAILTPTWQRTQYLTQTWRYVQAQQLRQPARLCWFVLDDSPTPDVFLSHLAYTQLNDASLNQVSLHIPKLSYHWLSKRMTLGEKRNELNALAMAWGADYFCSMDDDDWYGPSYVQDMIDLLEQSDWPFAGSSADYGLDVTSGNILNLPALTPTHSCHGVLCYGRNVALTSRYDNTRHSGEEPAFMQNRPVIQHPDVSRVHLFLAHASNTVSKKNYILDPRFKTSKTLDDFPMLPEDKAFYLNLVKAHQSQKQNKYV